MPMGPAYSGFMSSFDGVGPLRPTSPWTAAPHQVCRSGPREDDTQGPYQCLRARPLRQSWTRTRRSLVADVYDEPGLLNLQRQATGRIEHFLRDRTRAV